MRRRAALSALLRTMKLWRERPCATAASDHVVQRGEPLLVPFLRLRNARDLAEIPDNHVLPLSPLTQAIPAVSGQQPRLH